MLHANGRLKGRWRGETESLALEVEVKVKLGELKKTHRASVPPCEGPKKKRKAAEPQAADARMLD